MLGVLTRGALDNGRGKARLNMFRHKHEVGRHAQHLCGCMWSV
jgi:GTPase